MVRKTRNVNIGGSRIIKAPDVRKREIIEEALLLFSKKGYKNTTISDLAQSLNISQGLCYRYFKSKNEIFVAAADYYASNIVEKLHSPLEDNFTAIEKFNDLIKRIFAYIILHHEFEGAPENLELRSSRLYYLSNQFIQALLPIVQQGVAEGIFRCSNYDYATRVSIFGLINAFHSEMPMTGIREYIINFVDNIREFVINVFDVDPKQRHTIGHNWDELKFLS